MEEGKKEDEGGEQEKEDGGSDKKKEKGRKERIRENERKRKQKVEKRERVKEKESKNDVRMRSDFEQRYTGHCNTNTGFLFLNPNCLFQSQFPLIPSFFSFPHFNKYTQISRKPISLVQILLLVEVTTGISIFGKGNMEI